MYIRTITTPRVYSLCDSTTTVVDYHTLLLYVVYCTPTIILYIITSMRSGARATEVDGVVAIMTGVGDARSFSRPIYGFPPRAQYVFYYRKRKRKEKKQSHYVSAFRGWLRRRRLPSHSVSYRRRQLSRVRVG